MRLDCPPCQRPLTLTLSIQHGATMRIPLCLLKRGVDFVNQKIKPILRVVYKASCTRRSRGMISAHTSLSSRRLTSRLPYIGSCVALQPFDIMFISRWPFGSRNIQCNASVSLSSQTRTIYRSTASFSSIGYGDKSYRPPYCTSVP